MELGHVEIVRVDADHREQAIAVRLAARGAQRLEHRHGLGRADLGRVIVQEPVLDVRERGVRHRRAQAITGALELGARLLRELARALRQALGVLDPGEEQEALTAPERLIERGEVALTLADGGARLLVVAEQVLDLAGDRLAQRLAEHVAERLELEERAAHQREPFGARPLLARQVAEQALAVRDVLGVTELLEARARELARRCSPPPSARRDGAPPLASGS